MSNKQLRKNIGFLDTQIGELTKELEGLMKDTKYDAKIKTLTDLTEIRSKLMKDKNSNERSEVVIELDKQIEELTMLVTNVESDEAYIAKVAKLDDLTKIRCQLADSKVKESNVPAIISGVVGISAILLVLNYEKTDIITSKAFSIATKMFRG